jgi:hypothetical protein
LKKSEGIRTVVVLALVVVLLVTVVSVALLLYSSTERTCERWYYVGFMETPSGRYEIGAENRIVSFVSEGDTFYLYDEQGRSYEYRQVLAYRLDQVRVIVYC